MTYGTSPRSAGLVARFAALLGVFALLIGALFLLIRPWYQSWGSSDLEQRTALPGDELGFPGRAETRAIAIAAPADAVFAWVAQLGQTRAGFYSYELLEDLVGCEMPRLERLEPALQHWSVGEKLWMYPPAKFQGQGYATLLESQPGRALVFGTHVPGAREGAATTGTWSFIVEPTGQHSSRLIVRGTGGTPPSLLGVAFQRTVFEPVHFAMERRMLEGIAALAEGRPAPSRLQDAAQLALWVLSFAAFAGCAGLVLHGARWKRSLLGFLCAGVVFQLLTFLQPALWIGLAMACVLIPFFLNATNGHREEASSPLEQPS